MIKANNNSSFIGLIMIKVEFWLCNHVSYRKRKILSAYNDLNSNKIVFSETYSLDKKISHIL